MRSCAVPLAWEEKENQENAASAGAFWEMAEDCIQLLKAQHGAAAGSWDAFVAPVDAQLKQGG